MRVSGFRRFLFVASVGVGLELLLPSWVGTLLWLASFRHDGSAIVGLGSERFCDCQNVSRNLLATVGLGLELCCGRRDWAPDFSATDGRLSELVVRLAGRRLDMPVVGGLRAELRCDCLAGIGSVLRLSGFCRNLLTNVKRAGR